MLGLLAIALLFFFLLWLIFWLSKVIWRFLSGSKPYDASANITLRNSDRIRFPPLSQNPSDPSQFDYHLVPFTNENPPGRGYVVERIADGQRMAWDFLSNRGEGMESHGVAGETHHLEDLQADSFRPPAPLSLVPEPTNRYDPHAVAVWDVARRHQAGYIPRSEARRIADRLHNGKVVECLSIWETIVKGERVSLRILLLDKKARLRKPSE